MKTFPDRTTAYAANTEAAQRALEALGKLLRAGTTGAPVDEAVDALVGCVRTAEAYRLGANDDLLDRPGGRFPCEQVIALR